MTVGLVAVTFGDGGRDGPEEVAAVGRDSLPVINVETVRQLLDDNPGAGDAVGLATSDDGMHLFVARRSAPEIISVFQADGSAAGSVHLGAPLLNRNGFGHDPQGSNVFALVRESEGPVLVSAAMGGAPSVVQSDVDAALFAGGVAIDRQRGVLYGAGPDGLVALDLRDGSTSLGAMVRRTPLERLLEGAPRGVAVDPESGDVYVADSGSSVVVRFDARGSPTELLDLAPEGIEEVLDIAVAPSADATDEPTVASLYVVSTTSGIDGTTVTELTTTPSSVSNEAGVVEVAELRQTIDLGALEPPSPDSASITWLPERGQLLVADSEIDEYDYFDGSNLRTIGLDGSVQSSASTLAWSSEPSGAAFDPGAGRLFTSDDDTGRVYEVDVGADTAAGTADDVLVGSFETASFGSTDPEDVAFDPVHGLLYVVDGADKQVFSIHAGPDGAFGTVDDTVTHFDVGEHGLIDPEGVAYDAEHDTVTVLDRGNPVAAEFEPGGGLLRYLDLSAAGTDTRLAGGAWAPASTGGGDRSLWVVDRGLDGAESRDGMLYEFAVPPLGGGTPSPVIGLQATVSFGAVGVDTTLRRDVTISNRGTAPIIISSLSVTGDDRRYFSVEDRPSAEGNGSLTVPPAQTVPVTVSFTPEELRDHTASLVVESNARGRPSVVVSLKGTGVVPEPRLAVSPSLVSFGSQRMGTSQTRELTISNRGTAPLRIRSARLRGPDRSAFSVTDLSGETVAIDGAVPSSVSFTPTAPGSYSATLTIRSNDSRRSRTVVRLSGRATEGRSSVAVEQIQSGTSLQSSTVGTGEAVLVDADQLYVAFVASRPSVPVRAVTGLGGAWFPVAEQCSARGATAVAAFATTTATTPSVVTATFDDISTSAVITVVEYAGTDLADPIGGIARANTLGPEGGCGGGADSAAYSLTVPATEPSSLVAAGVATRNRTHVPAAGVSPLPHVTSGSAGNAAGLGVVVLLGAEDASSTSVNGSFDGSTDWAAVAFSIRSGP